MEKLGDVRDPKLHFVCIRKYNKTKTCTIEWLIYFSLDPIFRKQIVEPVDWRPKIWVAELPAFENSKPFRSDQLDLLNKKLNPLWIPMFWICFWKYLCFEYVFENTYVLSSFWKIWTPPKKSPSVLIHLKFSLRSEFPNQLFDGL